jgi:hypothetical protein
MDRLRRKNVLTRSLVLLLCVGWVGVVCAADRPRGNPYRGEPTAERAARLERTLGAGETPTLASWKPSGGFLSSYAPADTAEVEFPEDEETSRKELIKDMGVFVVVSAFIGYFIVKVFLEGDTEELPPDDDGKIIPDPTLSRAVYHRP